MDKKQEYIFYKICKKFKLPKDNTFIQHRNLKEFRYFTIERINPTHRLFLYGKLKRGYNKTNDANRLLKVGEILLMSGFLIMPIDLAYMDYLIKSLTTLLLFGCLYDLLFDAKIMRYINVNWNRRRYWLRKNIIRC